MGRRQHDDRGSLITVVRQLDGTYEVYYSTPTSRGTYTCPTEAEAFEWIANQARQRAALVSANELQRNPEGDD